MQEQRTLVQSHRRGLFATARRALASDASLTARAIAALAGAVTAGGVVGLALALLLDRPVPVTAWLLFGLSEGAVVGLGLAVWAITDRRHPRRARRAHRRAALACVAAGLTVWAVALASVDRLGLVAVLLGAGLAILVAGTGLLAVQEAERVALYAAAARRAAWLAQLRASRLTRRMLGMAAYRQLRRERALPVESTLYPHRTYLVPLRTTPAGARILVLERGKPIGGLCLRPREPLPDPEEALTHIMAIRTDERAWLERANYFPQDRHLTPQALGLLPGRPGNYDR